MFTVEGTRDICQHEYKALRREQHLEGYRWLHETVTPRASASLSFALWNNTQQKYFI